MLPDGSGRPGQGCNSMRVISSTTRNLEEEMKSGRFQEELYYRINGVHLRLPPLRDRSEDIPALLEFFFKKYTSLFERAEPKLSDSTMSLLLRHSWPGNIRELENVARKIVALGDEHLATHDLSAENGSKAPGPLRGAPKTSEPVYAHGPTRSLKEAARAASRVAERAMILSQLERTHWNRKKAARELQISYKALLYKLKQLGSGRFRPSRRAMRRTAMNKNILIFMAALSLVCVGSARAGAQDKKSVPSFPSANAPAGDDVRATATPATTDPAYVIGAQDMLDINVWKEPDMTRIVPVRPDGKISLPLINDVQAAGSTPQQLATDITAKLKKFLTDPQVTVIVTAINSQRVFVIGEVLHAGAFQLVPGTTVLQALANAGGFTTFANVKKIHVMRVVNGKHVELPFNYREVLNGDSQDQNIKLEPGDTVVVP